MVDPLDVYFAHDAASPDDRAALRVAMQAAMAEEPALAALAVGEQQAAQRWGEYLPTRDLLVLLALDEARHDLDADERARLDAARPALARLRAAVPAVETVLARIAAEAADFENCWNEAAERPAAFEAATFDTERFAAERASDRAPRAHGRVRRLAWRTSLVFTLAMIAVVSVLMLRRDASRVTVIAEAAQTVHLGDGTSVRLRPGATLAYVDPAKAPSRSVTLTGDAVFDVATTGAPFTVETPSGRVVVTGTVFGVRASSALTEVTLVEGRVLLASRDAATGVTLAPGQQSRVVPGALPTTPSDVDLSGEMAWSGRFYFRDTPLRAAAERLSAHYGTPVVVDARLGQERVNGAFDDTTPLAEILGILAQTLPSAQLDRTAGGFRLR